MTVWILAALLAFFVKGVCGFANTLIFTTMLSFGSSNANISPVELVLGYPTNAILAWRERKSIRWRIVLPLTAFMLLGNIPGVLFLKNADAGAVKLAFGVLIVFLGAEMLLRERTSAKRELPKAAGAVTAVLSGLLCGLYGIGALLGAYMSRITEDSHAFKGNLCFVFWAENTFRVILYAAGGLLTADVLKQAVLLAPFMLAGLFLGIGSSRFLRESAVKKIVIVMLIVSGIALIFNSL